ncbi:heme utilization protein [Pseudomonas protegens]|uniref:heme utilization protein n=1 Tax=Pseudomonas protegens TaxID=380021 RepID=UPI00080712EE|nr:heme utilization protein [Pseudomonas protegens]OBZ23110.1 heme utilization protein [Pseudomonas protegens]OBZ30520.1 heme utilization protein [Pseudomonas protegens]OKK44336.1 heme utilization protein [Pseudomonas protegens]OKK50301.1 heme utilization protein [Pseudomonas protegens]OKK56363.1 heme utilization protein [Pseudomonas protegens]
MKPTMALKPLVFALAAVMAMAAQAGGNDHGNNGGHGNGHGDHDQGPDLSTLLQITAGAGAAVIDVQNSNTNVVKNQGTNNNAKADNSLNNSNGNMGANVAAGDGNQQDNAAALATADESFIFGSAVAASSATQVNNNNYVKNSSTQNNAVLNNSGNNGSGNIGINVTAGDFNQQKNNLAIAVSGGRVATAAASANQQSTSLVVDNKGVQAYKKDTLTGGFVASGTYKGTGSGKIEGGDDHGSGHGYGDNKGHGNDDQKLTFKEQGTIELAGYWTQQVLTKDGWKNPVVNNASMTNSMNGFSGNGGANVSAGVGNQQSNSLSIAAGCKACM